MHIARGQPVSSSDTHDMMTSVTTDVVAGGLLVAFIGAQYPGTLLVADSAHDTWASLPEQSNTSCGSGSGDGVRAQIWYTTPAAAMASDVVTLTSTESDEPQLTVVQYTATSPLALDMTTSTTAPEGGDPTIATVGPLGLTGCADVVVCLYADGTDFGPFTLQSQFTALGNGSKWAFTSADELDVDAGTVSAFAIIPQGGDSCWATTAASFKILE